MRNFINKDLLNKHIAYKNEENNDTTFTRMDNDKIFETVDEI